MIPPSTVIRVLERREEKMRREVARVAREVAAKQDSLAALDETIAAVERRMCDNSNARFSDGSRSVAQLLELEQNSQSLRAGHAELEILRTRSRQALATLMDQQRTLSKEWRKEEVRLSHVSDLAQREHILTEVRQFDADEEAFAERYGIAAVFGGSP